MSGSAQPRPKGQVPPRGGSKKGRTQSRPAPSDASASGGSATKSTSASQPLGRQAAAQARRKRNRWLAIGSVAVVVVVVAVFVVVKVAGGGSSGPPREPIPADQMAHLTSVPVSTLVEGTADKNLSLTPPQAAVGGARLTAAGNPEMLFVGAEFCPICATERWVMLVALSHFGTFANVSKTHSAVRDGNIARPCRLQLHVHQSVPDLHSGGDHHQPTARQLLQDLADADSGAGCPVESQRAGRPGGLSVHRHRWQVGSGQLPVLGHAPSGEEFLTPLSTPSVPTRTPSA